MSEQDQGAANDGPPQPRTGTFPPAASPDPAQPVGPDPADVDEVPAGEAGDVAGADADPGWDPNGTVRLSPPRSPDPGGAPGQDVPVAEPVTEPDPAGASPHLDPAQPQPEPDQTGPDQTQTQPPGEPGPGRGLSADAQAALDVVTELAAMVKAQSERDHEQLAALAAGITEANRLRARDQAHVDQLHNDNTSLRRGELTSAMAPLLNGLVRLSDQMASMAGGDKNSIAGMLRVQLLQTMDVAAGVTEFSLADGETFDPKRMTGAGREDTNDPDQDGTVSRTVRSGFTRGDGSIVRVAEVVVRRLAPTPRPAGAGSEQ